MNLPYNAAFVAVITILSNSMLTIAWVDYDLVKVETLNSTTKPMDCKITKKRIDRYTFVIDGSIGFEDLSPYEAELKIYHSAPESSKFVLSPFKLPRMPCKEALNRDYRKYLMNDVKDYSDLPFSDIESEDLFPKFQNKKFHVNQFILHNTTIPDIADGTYKCYLLLYKGDVVVNAIYVMLKLY